MVEPQTDPHCTRCLAPFHPRAIRFMVREHSDVLDAGIVIARGQTVLVCKACVTPDERAMASAITGGRETTCAACGCRMRDYRLGLWVRRQPPVMCSIVCAQRTRRANRRRRQPRMRTRCAVCGTSFTPKRTDARYCGSACRQRAYRQRS
jgi:hypothetical protein